MPHIIGCEGEVTVERNMPVCESGWITVEHYEVTPPFDLTTLDPVVMTGMFGAGFVLFIVPWAAAYGAKQMLSLLK